MSNHYSYGRLVQTDILPRHNNTWYYQVAEDVYEFYSYDTLVGYIDCGPQKLFVEWAHTTHYSATTSKQCTILANELRRRFAFDHYIVKREIGHENLNRIKRERN